MWKFIFSDHPRMNGLCVCIVMNRDIDVRVYTHTLRPYTDGPRGVHRSSTAVGHGLKDR